MSNLKHKIITFKAFDVASHLPFKILVLYLIDLCEVEIEHHTEATV